MLADRKIALLGSDGNNDTAPSAIAGVDFPSMCSRSTRWACYLLDYLVLGPGPAVWRVGRWSFLCVIAPLRLAVGTGSPVNPIAIL